MSYIDDILATPHALIAGTTGSGKSVCLAGVINKILDKAPETTGMVLFDLKRIELKRFKDAPHCLGFITEPFDVTQALDKCNVMIDDAYKAEKADYTLYVIVDELADTLNVKGALERLTRIGRIGRGANVHLICATQDPSRRTLKAELMQNFTLTIALRCRSAIESRQIIGIKGAESLPQYGKGLMWDARGVQEINIEKVPDEKIATKVGYLQDQYRGRPLLGGHSDGGILQKLFELMVWIIWPTNPSLLALWLRLCLVLLILAFTPIGDWYFNSKSAMVVIGILVALILAYHTSRK